MLPHIRKHRRRNLLNTTAKEQQELNRLRKALEKTDRKGYLAYILMILSMAYIVDEIATNIFNAVQSEMVTEFYVRGMGLPFNTGLAAYSAMTAPLFVCMQVIPFYKALADRFGRKLFLAINTFGSPRTFSLFCFPVNPPPPICAFPWLVPWESCPAWPVFCPWES